MAGDIAYGDVTADEDLVAWSREYCRGVRRERGVDVRFDLVEWAVSHRAKRRAAAVKRPKLPDATVGEPYDWDALDGADGRPLPCTLSLTREAFEAFDRDEWAATLRHELVHVEQYQRDGTTDHGAAFRERAADLNTEVHCSAFADAKYVLTCEDCGGLVARRYRDCPLVRQRERYRSDCCGAALALQ
ncbi:transcription elongation protein SprT [Haloarcula onubensis]|uniref:Transcription elongation protein SprT n=1 Tax=Haloarcula onubensis TaxID=2950539 RepID=A0ABU2FNI0_9EURY|nr:transcription elongation protein SprT [Halomicroarcula sp. S3CR25-11]MDS0282309.1 transcription elongation protein SprT [Halomicroarcula sp. S3CR25-11]